MLSPFCKVHHNVYIHSTPKCVTKYLVTDTGSSTAVLQMGDLQLQSYSVSKMKQLADRHKVQWALGGSFHTALKI